MTLISEFAADTILYGGDEVAEIYDDTSAFLVWVNQMLVNRHEEICAMTNKWTTDDFTFSIKGFEEAVPSDWDTTSQMILYTDSDHQNSYDAWEMRFGVHRFDMEQAASKTYYRRYRQMPTVYTAVENTFAEIANPRLKKILMDEVIALYISTLNDLETSNAESNALSKADRIS